MHIEVKQWDEPQLGTAAPDVVAGVLCGLIAGAAYLVAQMLFAAMMATGKEWEPLQRIAAILLGSDSAPPSSEFSLTTAGMALLIHFPLAAIYGRIVDWLVRGCTLAQGAIRGGTAGAFIFFVNFWLLAPLAFPWFEQSRNLVTAFDHVMFGALAAVCCLLIRRRGRGPANHF